MGKTIKFTALFSKPNTTANEFQNPTPTPKSSSPSSSSSSSYSSFYSWPPSCTTHPKTNSFNNDIYKTMNSVFYPLHPSDYSSYSSDSDSESESVISNLKASSTRLFFEPGAQTSSIMESHNQNVNKSSSVSVMAMESKNPYVDFRKSMEEMIAAYDMMKDWDALEQMLVWYLRVNGEVNHGFIVSAFVDLLVGINSHLGVCKYDHEDDDDVVVGCCFESMCSTSR